MASICSCKHLWTACQSMKDWSAAWAGPWMHFPDKELACSPMLVWTIYVYTQCFTQRTEIVIVATSDSPFIWEIAIHSLLWSHADSLPKWTDSDSNCTQDRSSQKKLSQNFTSSIPGNAVCTSYRRENHPPDLTGGESSLSTLKEPRMAPRCETGASASSCAWAQPRVRHYSSSHARRHYHGTRCRFPQLDRLPYWAVTNHGYD